MCWAPAPARARAAPLWVAAKALARCPLGRRNGPQWIWGRSSWCVRRPAGKACSAVGSRVVTRQAPPRSARVQGHWGSHIATPRVQRGGAGSGGASAQRAHALRPPRPSPRPAPPAPVQWAIVDIACSAASHMARDRQHGRGIAFARAHAAAFHCVEASAHALYRMHRRNWGAASPAEPNRAVQTLERLASAAEAVIDGTVSPAPEVHQRASLLLCLLPTRPAPPHGPTAARRMCCSAPGWRCARRSVWCSRRAPRHGLPCHRSCPPCTRTAATCPSTCTACSSCSRRQPASTRRPQSGTCPTRAPPNSPTAATTIPRPSCSHPLSPPSPMRAAPDGRPPFLPSVKSLGPQSRELSACAPTRTFNGRRRQRCTVAHSRPSVATSRS